MSQVGNLIQQVGPVVTAGESQSSIAVTIAISSAEKKALGLPDEQPGLLSGCVNISASSGVGVEGVQIIAEDDYNFLQRLLGSLYQPGSELGVIDHIGPIRTPGTGQVQSLDFSRQSLENELQGLILYSGNKFASLPNDIVRMHMVDLQERDARVQKPHRYIDRVRDIFQHFLPDAEFSGVHMDPELISPAQILVKSGGAEHDISQLSSGQREVLMTYTHLEKLAPRNSIILFDEPKLHLHPALERRVISYLRRLLERNNSQIWVVTHSEEIIGTTEYDSLYRMTGLGNPSVEPVRDKAGRIALLAEMGAGVGLQLVSPRILMVEGESDKDLLTAMVDKWPSGIGLVEAKGKGTMMRISQQALDLLESVLRDGELFFVRDHDHDDPSVFDGMQQRYNGQFFVWTRYHIENYLLDGESISSVLHDFPELGLFLSGQEVEQKLRAIADETRNVVLAARLQAMLNTTIRKYLVLNPSDGLKESLLKAAEARRDEVNLLLTEEKLLALLATEEAELREKWETHWKELCIGRKVLQTFHSRHVAGKRGKALGYEIFRNRIAVKLRDTGRVPEEIKQMIARVSAGLPSPETAPNA